MKQRIADYIADFLAGHDIDTVFTVVGGGAMHLNDAFGKHEKLQVIHNHHEQASAMAAEGYARIKEKPACVCVTTGPGGTNAMTGVLCAYQDNVPMIVISGQVRYSTTVESTGLDLRQFGEQEYHIVRSVKPMTKYAYMVKEPSEIRYVLEKAYYEATHGRRGPVWIDVPLNVQGAIYEIDNLKGYSAPNDNRDYKSTVQLIIDKLRKSKRPLILAGASIRRSGARDIFLELVNKLNIPVLSATCVADVLPLNHPLHFEHFGVDGGRAGNFLLQNADVIITMGCRLSFNQIGFNYKAFAPTAYKIVIDIDANELRKPTVKIDLPIQADLKTVLTVMNEIIDAPMKTNEDWLGYARVLYQRYNRMLNINNNKHGINPYCMIEKLVDNIGDEGIIVVGNSSGSAMGLEYGVKTISQRLFGNRNCGTMGYDLPAALGAAVASKKQVVCLTGDGSIQMNLQELQTMVLNKIPIKIMIYNNNGYAGIVRTQSNYFAGRLNGCTPESGLDCPDWKKIAYAYGLPFKKIENVNNLDDQLKEFLAIDGYALCEIIEDSAMGPAFKTTSKKLDNGEMVSAPLDELAPALSDEEFHKYRYFENYLKG